LGAKYAPSGVIRLILPKILNLLQTYQIELCPSTLKDTIKKYLITGAVLLLVLLSWAIYPKEAGGKPSPVLPSTYDYNEYESTLVRVGFVVIEEKTTPKSYAKSKVGAEQFICLDKLITKESNWRSDAQNKTSTAYGQFQFLDSTWAGTGIAKTSDPFLQIDAGYIYILRRYGSPCGAWAHSVSHNWY